MACEAAVLGILRALRVVELRDEWRRSAQRLIHDAALRDLFSRACPLLMVGKGAVVPKLVEELEGDLCEELSMVLGLMTWLAWESELDVGIARERNGWAGVEDKRWTRLQRLAYLAPHFASDERALEIATASVHATPRRRQDGDAWIARQQSFMDEIASVVANPEACTRVTRSPQPGDIVCLPQKFNPRIRLVLEIRAGSRGQLVAVVDEDTKDGEKSFLADRLTRLIPPSQVELGAG